MIRRPRGRPATPDEAVHARRLVMVYVVASDALRRWAQEHSEIRQQEVADLLGVDRGTVRRWQASPPVN
jgi:hypothetical protein